MIPWRLLCALDLDRNIMPDEADEGVAFAYPFKDGQNVWSKRNFCRIGTPYRRSLVAPPSAVCVGEGWGVRVSRASPSPNSRIRSHVLSTPERLPARIAHAGMQGLPHLACGIHASTRCRSRAKAIAPARSPGVHWCQRFAASRRATVDEADRRLHAWEARRGVTMISRCHSHRAETCIPRSKREKEHRGFPKIPPV